jgi:hypothetical protein
MMTPRQVADLAERYLAGEVSHSEFMDATYLQDNERLVFELVQEIEHEPRLKSESGKLLAQGKQYLEEVHRLIGAIKAQYRE